MRVLFSGGILPETCAIDLVSRMLNLLQVSWSLVNELMEDRRCNERFNPLHNCCGDPHLYMAICSVEVLSHRCDGGIWASIVHFLSGCGFFMKHIVNRFCSGVYVSMVSNPIMDMGETGDVGRRTGMFLSIQAVGALVGPPISGAIKSAAGNFKSVGYYAGGPLKLDVVLRIQIHSEIP